MRRKKQRKNKLYVVVGILVVLLIMMVFQSVLILMLLSELRNINSRVQGGTFVGTVKGGVASGGALEQILEEITPRGTPSYGMEAGVSYDKVEDGLRTLVRYHRSILLSGGDKQRYIDIATSQGTACEFCCGIGEAGFGTSDGRIACGCSHNVAFSGLTKWLIKNTDFSDQQIIDEIQKWKVLFFPRGAVEKELEKRSIRPESVGLPAMRGGC